MKILGVGFNYRPHVAEAPQLGLPEQAVDTPPLFFHKGNALLKPRTPFQLRLIFDGRTHIGEEEGRAGLEQRIALVKEERRSWSSRSVG